MDSATHSVQSNRQGSEICVNCCSEDGTEGYRPNPCVSAVTFYEAEQVCSDAGYRLCSADEIGAIGAQNDWNGCRFDEYLVWTSDRCAPSANAAHAPPKYEMVPRLQSKATTIELSSKWALGGVGLLLIYTLAVLLAGKMCHSTRSTMQYTKVNDTDCDCESFINDAADAISVE